MRTNREQNGPGFLESAAKAFRQQARADLSGQTAAKSLLAWRNIESGQSPCRVVSLGPAPMTVNLTRLQHAACA